MSQEEAYKHKIEQLKRRIAELEAQAQTDELTLVLNRRGLMSLLRAYIGEVDFQLKNPDRRKFLIVKSFSLLFIDIDYFKKINDQFGHSAGDTVLREIAQAIRNTLRGIDVVGRYGGEELMVGLVGADLEHAASIAEELRARIESLRLQVGVDVLKVTASFGVATMRPGLSLEDLIKEADEALYKAKNDGRNRVEVHG